MKISEILLKYKTDKATAHSYGPMYDKLFALFNREDKLRILELGVQGGGSLLAWQDYFPNAKIVGVDLSDSRYDDYKREGIEFIRSDLRDMPVSGTFDIIIDDSDHFDGTQVFIVKNYYPLLAPKGVLVIEDIQTSDALNEIIKVQPVSAIMEVYDYRQVTGRHDDLAVTITAP